MKLNLLFAFLLMSAFALGEIGPMPTCPPGPNGSQQRCGGHVCLCTGTGEPHDIDTSTALPTTAAQSDVMTINVEKTFSLSYVSVSEAKTFELSEIGPMPTCQLGPNGSEPRCGLKPCCP